MHAEYLDPFSSWNWTTVWSGHGGADFLFLHDDVIKWKHFPRYWPFVRGIHLLPVNSRHKGQWRRVLMFLYAWSNGKANNRDADDLRRHRAHYDVAVTWYCCWLKPANKAAAPPWPDPYALFQFVSDWITGSISAFVISIELFSSFTWYYCVYTVPGCSWYACARILRCDIDFINVNIYQMNINKEYHNKECTGNNHKVPP